MEKSRLLWAASDSWVMLQRNIKHLVRNPESLFINIFLPVVLMLMFVYVFGGAIQTGTAYVNYIVPGIIIFCAGYGSSMTAVSVSQDRLGGLFERLRSMPVHPSSFMLGHVIGSFVRNAISAALVFVVAFLLGFRPEAGWLDWLGVVLLLSLFILSVCWLAVVFGLLAKSVEIASAFTFIVMFMPYVSSAFVPTDTMPSWLRAYADYQPFTPLIETLRGLLLDTDIGRQSWIAVVWFGGLLFVSYIVAMILFRRKG
ncbi:ABC transporter permease [Paenibacillus sp. 32O-W]|uniref:ABC transporter permease n=1 Tax=Paenibacillus sp. 32O-W TaxID=1695218 RepID=UPI000722CCA7|nr:ABC transporter permease [Paenibacillus sp. 32O-W]ALS29083.1 ABC transporter permease [Paenibacillus sp. 32O-W]